MVAIGLVLGSARLGVWTPPFVIRWQPRLDSHAWVALLAIGGALSLAPLIGSRLPSGVTVAVALWLVCAGLGLGLNLVHDGVRGWWAVFAVGRNGSFEGRFEYLLSLPALRSGVGYYLAHFGGSIFPYLTTHVKGNPPGPLILLHLLGIGSAPMLAGLCVVVGSMSAPLTYWLGRSLGGEERGRVAGLLTAFAPSMLLFGVSSFDFVFCTLGLTAAGCLVLPRRRWLVLGALATAVATFFSWLLFAVPAWCAVVVWRRRGWRAAAAVLASAALGVVVWNATLALAFGYDPFRVLTSLLSAYRGGAAAGRPYPFWLFGSPTAWAVMLGLPIVWFAVRALVRGDETALALWLMIAAAAVIGVTKAETERIWLPFVPLACVTAAAALPVRRLWPVLAVLCVQALAIEVLFFTIW